MSSFNKTIKMNRKLVIGDIHGGYKALIEILDNATVTNKDELIFLGDYVDGWSQSPEVLDLLIALGKKQKCIFIRGNHDQLFLDWLENNKAHVDEGMWFKHGGKSTVDAYKHITDLKKKKHIQFLKNLKNYYIDSENNLFVHAGFTNPNGVHHEYFAKTLYWDRTLWETVLCMNKKLNRKSVFYPKRITNYNEIYIGHTPVNRIGETTPQKFANVWNIDTGAAFNGCLTIMDIKTKQFWQSNPVNLSYPLEKGRN
jgi:serine/threonine protein phosphatase 1